MNCANCLKQYVPNREQDIDYCPICEKLWIEAYEHGEGRGAEKERERAIKILKELQDSSETTDDSSETTDDYMNNLSLAIKRINAVAATPEKNVSTLGRSAGANPADGITISFLDRCFTCDHARSKHRQYICMVDECSCDEFAPIPADVKYTHCPHSSCGVHGVCLDCYRKNAGVWYAKEQARKNIPADGIKKKCNSMEVDNG